LVPVITIISKVVAIAQTVKQWLIVLNDF